MKFLWRFAGKKYNDCLHTSYSTLQWYPIKACVHVKKIQVTRGIFHDVPWVSIQCSVTILYHVIKIDTEAKTIIANARTSFPVFLVVVVSLVWYKKEEPSPRPAPRVTCNMAVSPTPEKVVITLSRSFSF